MGIPLALWQPRCEAYLNQKGKLNMNEIFIERSDDTLSSVDLKLKLEKLPEWDNSINLKVRNKNSLPLRTGIDPTILVAACTMTGTLLVTLIGGLTKIALETFKEEVTIEFENGTKIKIKGRNVEKKLSEIRKLLESNEIKRIII